MNDLYLHRARGVSRCLDQQLEICDPCFKILLFLRSFEIENREKGCSEAEL